MRAKLLVWILAVLLLVNMAVAYTDSATGLVEFWTSNTGAYNATHLIGGKGAYACELKNSPTTGASGILAEATDYPDTATQHSNCAHPSAFDSTTPTYTAWVYIDGAGQNAGIIGVHGNTAVENGLDVEIASNKFYYSVYYNAGASSLSCNVAENVGVWIHLASTYNGTHLVGYKNGTVACSTAGSITPYGGGSEPFYLGNYYDGTYTLNGAIDEATIWNRSLNETEIQEVMLGITSGGGGTTTDLYITAKDEWNGTSISSFNANISWTNGSTTSHSSSGGNIYLSNLSNGGTTYNITFWNATDYFNSVNQSVTLTNATNNTLIGRLHQAEVCFNSTAKVSGAGVTLNNVTIASTVRTASPFCFNISAGTYSVKAQKTGWYSLNQSFVVTALQNNTQTIANMSHANFTISAKDGTTNASLTSCDTSLNSINWTTWTGESQTATTNASYYLINGTYNASIVCPGYALTFGLANVTVSGNTNYTFTLYKTNSVIINILDEITNAPILSNITIRWTNNATTWENITDTSHLFVYNLTPSNYTLLFYGSNYSTRTYTITVGNLSTQFLTAYMISSVYSTIFTVKDKDTGDIQPDVTFTVYKLVNSTWQTVESKYTDITGKVQIYYDPIGNYRFYLAKASYEDLIFYLNPILFDTYDVFMEKSNPLNYTVDYDDISIIYSPHSFNNNANTTFNFLISSPDGQLTSYGIKLTFPGGVKTASGVNAIGEQLSTVVNMSGATRWDRVTLEYNYTTTLAGTRTFTQYLSINTNATASENTWMANKDRTFGLGIFERTLIVTIIVIFIVGISTMVGQPIAGMVIGIFMFGFLTFVGFVPIWVILPSIIIGIFFLVWKSGG